MQWNKAVEDYNVIDILWHTIPLIEGSSERNPWTKGCFPLDTYQRVTRAPRILERHMSVGFLELDILSAGGV